MRQVALAAMAALLLAGCAQGPSVEAAAADPTEATPARREMSIDMGSSYYARMCVAPVCANMPFLLDENDGANYVEIRVNGTIQEAAFTATWTASSVLTEELWMRIGVKRGDAVEEVITASGTSPLAAQVDPGSLAGADAIVVVIEPATGREREAGPVSTLFTFQQRDIELTMAYSVTETSSG